MYKNILKFSSFLINLFRKGDKTEWQRIIETLNTPYELMNYYIKKGFKHVNDKFPDNYKQPEVFLEDRTGDCDDFAKTTFEFLKRKGYDALFIGLWKNHYYGHAIVVFTEKDGSFSYASNIKIVTGFKTYKEAVYHYYGAKTRHYEVIED